MDTLASPTRHFPPSTGHTGRPSGDHQRAMLMALVAADPGVHILRAAHVLGMNWNTCYHHVRCLVDDGRLAVSKVRGKVCLFDRKEGAVGGRIVSALLRDERTHAIARVLVEHPGMNQQSVAAHLGIAASAAHRHLRRLEGAGLLHRVHQSREVANYPTDPLRLAIAASNAATGPAGLAEAPAGSPSTGFTP